MASIHRIKNVVLVCILTFSLVCGQNDGDLLPHDDLAMDELLATAKPTDVKPDLAPLNVIDDIVEDGSGDIETPIVPQIVRQVLQTFVISLPKCQVEEEELGQIVLKCINGQLTEIPKELNTSMVSLNLKSNNFTTLTSEMFPEILPNLKALSLADNQITKIDRAVFEKLPNLERLNLQCNQLTSLDVEIFSSLKFLNDLDLTGNKLAPLPPAGMFLNAPAMKKLSIADCGLSSVPENAFDGMTSLTWLDIGRNPIEASMPITGGVFAALANLTTVALPTGVSKDLVLQVCSSHSLLETVCVTPCDDGPIACVAPSVEIPDEIIIPAEAPITAGPVETMAEETATTQLLQPNISTEKIVDSESKPPVSTASSNNVVIGLIVGAILVAVVAVVLKKNWSKITGKSREIEGNGSLGAPKAMPRLPEEIPLQQNNSPA